MNSAATCISLPNPVVISSCPHRQQIRTPGHPGGPGAGHHGLSEVRTLRPDLQTRQLCVRYVVMLQESWPNDSPLPSSHGLYSSVCSAQLSLCPQTTSPGLTYAAAKIMSVVSLDSSEECGPVEAVKGLHEEQLEGGWWSREDESLQRGHYRLQVISKDQ